jgi:hypothetical protein
MFWKTRATATSTGVTNASRSGSASVPAVRASPYASAFASRRPRAAAAVRARCAAAAGLCTCIDTSTSSAVPARLPVTQTNCSASAGRSTSSTKWVSCASCTSRSAGLSARCRARDAPSWRCRTARSERLPSACNVGSSTGARDRSKCRWRRSRGRSPTVGVGVGLGVGGADAGPPSQSSAQPVSREGSETTTPAAVAPARNWRRERPRRGVPTPPDLSSTCFIASPVGSP